MIRGACLLLLSMTFIVNQLGTAQAATPQIRAVASKTDVLIAQTFSVRLEAIVDAGGQVEFGGAAEATLEDSKTEERLGVFDILSTHDLMDIPLNESPTSEFSESEVSIQRRVWSRTITLETIRLGIHTIPSMNVAVTNEGNREIFPTAPIEITVRGVIEEADEPLREIVGAIETESNESDTASTGIITWLLALAAVAAIATGTVTWYRRRQYHPLRWCDAELAQLETENKALAENSEPTRWLAFTQRIREVLRVAVSSHRQKEIAAPSTKQLLDQCHAVMPNHELTACVELLSLADRMKFDSQPIQSPFSAEMNFNALQETTRFVDSVRTDARKRKRGN